MFAWKDSPDFGVGLGRYQKATAESDVGYKCENIHSYDTSHSTYIMILTESGIVGLGRFLVWDFAFFVSALAVMPRTTRSTTSLT